MTAPTQPHTIPAIEARITLDRPRRLLFDDVGLRRYERIVGHPVASPQSRFDPEDLATLLWSMALAEDPHVTREQIRASFCPQVLLDVGSMLRQVGSLIKSGQPAEEVQCRR